MDGNRDLKDATQDFRWCADGFCNSDFVGGVLIQNRTSLLTVDFETLADDVLVGVVAAFFFDGSLLNAFDHFVFFVAAQVDNFADFNVPSNQLGLRHVAGHAVE